MREIVIPIEPLEAAAFRPFGRVIERRKQAAAFEAHPNRMIDLGFTLDGNAALYLIRYIRQDIVVTQMERHLTMTESRVALGTPAVIFVSTGFDLEGDSFIEGAIRAFLIAPNQGLIFNRGTWHSMDCFPFSEPWADFAFFSEREAEAELADLELQQCVRTDIINLEQRFQLRLIVSDPQGLRALGTHG
jgi:ureidoglycolate hydrolase